jgi:hypothetical protein
MSQCVTYSILTSVPAAVLEVLLLAHNRTHFASMLTNSIYTEFYQTVATFIYTSLSRDDIIRLLLLLLLIFRTNLGRALVDALQNRSYLLQESCHLLLCADCYPQAT